MRTLARKTILVAVGLLFLAILSASTASPAYGSTTLLSDHFDNLNNWNSLCLGSGYVEINPPSRLHTWGGDCGAWWWGQVIYKNGITSRHFIIEVSASPIGGDRPWAITGRKTTANIRPGDGDSSQTAWAIQFEYYYHRRMFYRGEGGWIDSGKWLSSGAWYTTRIEVNDNSAIITFQGSTFTVSFNAPSTWYVTIGSTGGCAWGNGYTDWITITDFSLTYPTDRWQRLWYVNNGGGRPGSFLGETSESSVQFDNDWGGGTVAYGRGDLIMFQSSRTIYLTAGSYRFLLGGDDGHRLWIDDVLRIDAWWPQGYTVHSVDVTLSSGNHRFRIDWYEDWGGARVSFNYQSLTVSITVTSNPTGSGFVKVDGSAITTPQTFSWAVGSTHTLETLSPVSVSSGIQYVWTSWSDGGAQTHVYTTPSSSQTVTANFKTQYYLEVDGATAPYLLFLLEEGSGSTIKDVSASYQGSVPSGVSWVSGQQSGTYALQFDGSNHIEVMADVPETDFIIEVRFKTTTTTTGIFSVLKDPNGVGGHDRHVYVSGGKICFRVWQGSGWSTDKVVNDGNWHTVVLVVRSGIGQFAYVDGILVGSFSYDHSDFNWQDRIGIGWSNDGGGNFNGVIDTVAIYKIQVGSGDGWKDAGTSASFSISTTTISMGTGRQLSFKGWELDYTGAGTSGSVTMNGPKVVKAKFVGEYQLTIQVDDSTHGSTTPAAGSYWYGVGASVSVTATPASRYTFDYWTLDGVNVGSSNPYSVGMGAPHTLKAFFKASTVQVTITSSPTGNGFVKVDGTTITTPQTYNWAIGSSHTVEALSLVGGGSGIQYLFQSWSDGGTQSHTITVSSSQTITANFKTQYYLTVSSAQDSPNPTSGWFDASASITASVSSPASGPSGTRYVCTGWTGTGSVPASGSSTSVTFTINAPSSITWNWKTQYQLSISVNNPSMGSTSPSPGSYWYDAGSNVQVTAIANPSYSLSHWNLDGSNAGSSNPFSVTMNAAHTLVAHFSGGAVAVTVTSSPAGSGFVKVDGQAMATPRTFTWAQGSSHTLEALSPVSGSSGIQYVWTSWSDGGAQSHQVTVSGSSLTYTANFKKQCLLLAVTNPAGLSPQPSANPAGPWYDVGVSVTLTANAIGGFDFKHWKLDGQGMAEGQNSITVTMNTPHTAIAEYAQGSPSPSSKSFAFPMYDPVIVYGLGIVASTLCLLAAKIRKRSRLM